MNIYKIKLVLLNIKGKSWNLKGKCKNTEDLVIRTPVNFYSFRGLFT